MRKAPTNFRIAIVGAGAMAREHARAFQDIDGVVLSGVFSRTREKSEQFADEFGVPEVCSSVAELFDRTKASLVVLAISPVHTTEIGLQCLQFPWTVLMEKPPGLDLEESLCLQSTARQLQRKVLVALNRRFYFSTQRALEDLNQRTGTRHIHVFDQQSVDLAARLGHDHGALLNWHYCCSVHMVDYLRVFGRGKPSVAHVFGSSDNAIVASLEFDSGDTAVYECIWKGPGPWAVMVTTADKRWEMRPLENLSYQSAGSRTLVPLTIDPIDTRFKAGFRLQAKHAVAATLGQHSCSVTLDDAVETMELVSDIYPSGWLSAQVGSLALPMSR